MIRLPIREADGRLTKWWINLCDQELEGSYSDMVKGLHESAGGYYCLPEERCGRSAYLEFEDDAKAAWFLLRWS